MRAACLLVAALAMPCSDNAPASDTEPSPVAQTQPPPWYALEPLLASLRPELRAAPPLAGTATDLPLYELDLDLDGDRFTLRQTLWFTQRERAPLSEIVLRLYANAPAAADTGPALAFVRGSCLDGLRCRVQTRSQGIVAVELERPLPHGARARISLELKGSLATIDSNRTNLLAQGLEGISRLGMVGSHEGYGLLARGDGIVSLAHFYPVLAARKDGAWAMADDGTLGDLGSDELSHVVARVTAERGMRAVAGGVRTGGRAQDGRERHEFAAGYVRDFSVLLSHAFAHSEQRVGSVAVRSHYLAAEAAAGKRVLDVAAAALAVFERRFGPYPYSELDAVEAPLIGGAGGVEFSGLLTVASMFYRPLDGSGKGAVAGLGIDLAAQKPLFDAMLEFVTAHEVAHQYFHGLVGSDSRERPFADEALAQYAALLYVEARHGSARAELEAKRQLVAGYHLMRLSQIADGPVDRPARQFKSQLEYAGLVYGKGPLVYRALRRTVGDSTFFGALRAYVDRYRFGEAPGRGFIELLAERGSAAQVQAVARRWLDQAHGDEDLGRPDLAQLMLAAGLPQAELGGLQSAELQQLMQSPELQQMMQGTDIQKLMQSPELQQMMQSPELQQMMQQLMNPPAAAGPPRRGAVD